MPENHINNDLLLLIINIFQPLKHNNNKKLDNKFSIRNLMSKMADPHKREVLLVLDIMRIISDL